MKVLQDLKRRSVLYIRNVQDNERYLTLVSETFFKNEDNIYGLRNRTDFTIRTVNSVRKGLESLAN